MHFLLLPFRKKKYAAKRNMSHESFTRELLLGYRGRPAVDTDFVLHYAIEERKKVKSADGRLCDNKECARRIRRILDTPADTYVEAEDFLTFLSLRMHELSNIQYHDDVRIEPKDLDRCTQLVESTTSKYNEWFIPFKGSKSRIHVKTSNPKETVRIFQIDESRDSHAFFAHNARIKFSMNQMIHSALMSQLYEQGKLPNVCHIRNVRVFKSTPKVPADALTTKEQKANDRRRLESMKNAGAQKRSGASVDAERDHEARKSAKGGSTRGVRFEEERVDLALLDLCTNSVNPGCVRQIWNKMPKNASRKSGTERTGAHQ